MTAAHRSTPLLCALFSMLCVLPGVAGAAPSPGGPSCADTATLEASAHGWSVSGQRALAEAYTCEGHPGRAILAYERARLLAPRASAIASALGAEQSAAGVTPARARWYVSMTRVLSSNAWTWLAAGSLWAGLIVLLLLQTTRRLFRAGAFALVGASMLFAVCAWSGSGGDQAIVVADHGAALRISPFASADVEASEPEGARMKILGHHGDHLRVRDGEGRTGWIDARAIESIVPRGEPQKG
ncbi:MAG: SH3 domain-containing protein [Polyangia bacterium]